MYFYTRRKNAGLLQENTEGSMSIIFGIISLLFCVFPYIGLLILGAVFGVSAIAFGILPVIAGRERGYIGIGLSMFTFAIILHYISF